MPEVAVNSLISFHFVSKLPLPLSRRCPSPAPAPAVLGHLALPQTQHCTHLQGLGLLSLRGPQAGAMTGL